MWTRSGLALATVASLSIVACKGGGSDKAKPTESVPSNGDPGIKQGENAGNGTATGTGTGLDPNIKASSVTISGSIALALGLQGGSHVSHVVALNTDSNDTAVAPVGADGKFELAVEKGDNYVLTYVDDSKVGEAQLVSRFSSGDLDTVATSDGAKGELALGNVDVSAEKAGSSTSAADLLAGMGMTAEAAQTYGAVDDVSLRYANPDIDADGKVDAVSGQKFPLDFHNRFNWKVPGNGNSFNQLAMKDIKNAFPPADAELEFTGSGIIPWFDDAVWAGQTLGDYSWTFSNEVKHKETCQGVNGSTLAANTECKLNVNVGNRSVAGKPSIELDAAVDGTYILKAAGKTFTWTNVKVSDFSGGDGFIALFTKMDVSQDDKLTGVSYKWQRRQNGQWVPATEEELKLLVAKTGGYMSLKVDGMNSGKELGVRLPLKPDGSIVFADAKFGGDDGDVNLPPQGLTEADVKAGLDWTRVLENPGISYDDKLGMRFFFGFSGQNN